MIVSEATLRARWVEAEVVHLKRMGLSFEAIAEQITRVGRGQAQPITPLPDGLSFPPDYQISRQACHQACRKAIAREPALEVEELRKIDHARSEDMFMNLQPAIRKGNARAIETGIKLLGHSARIHGYAAPQRHELTGKDSVNLSETRCIPISLIDRLTRAHRESEFEREAGVTGNKKAAETTSDDSSDASGGS